MGLINFFEILWGDNKNIYLCGTQKTNALTKMLDRRTFIKSLAALGVAGVMPQSLKAGVGLGDEAIPLLAVNNNALRITGTFLDEISHDIPHQNWGEKEWDADFRYMKAIGIDTVIMIRCGYRKFITYPSAYLVGKGCYAPSGRLA